MSDLVEIKKYPFLYLDGISGSKNNLKSTLQGSLKHDQRHFLIFHGFYQETDIKKKIIKENPLGAFHADLGLVELWKSLKGCLF